MAKILICDCCQESIEGRGTEVTFDHPERLRKFDLCPKCAGMAILFVTGVKQLA